ncbi:MULTISPECIES: hypothetical protein [Pseudonocardia]|uniref:Uncharacterized protein n=2 Tax=Pseudonocardia TaxID=1847 RepID=A0A1Y2N3R8_PSEAH|nr:MULTISPECIES: hypothetical protein [Pseudonocardia]OSY42115.1 hypothetical protein BG845_01611 [Pseudonocardia autotrophica]TDN75117.1 hypothetical protein C8E95_4260 [Pseudonocardia autotrophica]BBF99062.1 hypothetical protein Pdca_02720 [Pseudonocardia autotrophica]GEC23982.1 hypothetical protein PSA01_10110 [Pseudonocardia saturnea]
MADEIELAEHARLVEEMPVRLTAAVAAGVLQPDEARELLHRARSLLQARSAASRRRNPW